MIKRIVKIFKNPLKYILSIESIDYDVNAFSYAYGIMCIIAPVVCFVKIPMVPNVFLLTIFSFFIFRMERIFFTDSLNLIIEMLCPEFVYKEQIQRLILPFLVFKNIIMAIMGVASHLVKINTYPAMIISYSIFVLHIFLILKHKFKISSLRSVITSLVFAFIIFLYLFLAVFNITSRIKRFAV